jgi:hypothetical protein
MISRSRQKQIAVQTRHHLVQLVFVASKVVQFCKRIVHVFPPAAGHGAKGGHGAQQGAGLEYVEAVNPETE